MAQLIVCGFVSDGRVSPAGVVDHVAGLVSSTERTAGLHNLLGDADVDRFRLTILFGISDTSGLGAISLQGHSNPNICMFFFSSLCSIIVKVKQHEEFFPAFHALVLDILHTLGKHARQ